MADKELQVVIKAKDEASSVFDAFSSAAKDSIVEIANVIPEVVESFSAIGVATKAVGAVFDAMSYTATIAFDAIKYAASAAWAAMTGGASLIKDAFFGAIELITNLGDTIRNLPSTIAGWGESLISPLTFFSDTILNVEKAVQSFTSGSFFELVSRGGEFAESYSAAAAAAEAYGVSIDKVSALVDKFSEGQLQLGERTQLAAKLISAGLNEDEIATALELIQKRSELTGQSFESLGNSVAKAFESGKFDRFGKELGIVIDKSDTASDVLEKMANKAATMGEGVFNAADNIKAINTDVSDWVTNIGKAINESDAFQRVVTYATEAVDDFVKNFDYKAVSSFFSGIIRAGEVMYIALSDTFGAAFSYVRDVLKKFGAGASSTDIFSYLVNSALSAARGILKSFQGIANGVGPYFLEMSKKGLMAFGDFFGYVAQTGENVVDVLGLKISRMFENAGRVARVIAGDTEGMETDEQLMARRAAEDKAIFDRKANNNTFAKKTADDINALIESIGNKVKTKFTFADDFDKISKEWENSLKKIKLPDVEPPKKADLKSARDAVADIEAQRAAAEQAKKDKLAEDAKKKEDARNKEALRAEKERQAEQKQADKEEADRQSRIVKDMAEADIEALENMKKALKQEKKIGEDKKKVLTDRIKDINEYIKKNTLQTGETFKVQDAGFNLTALQDELKSLNKELKKIDDEEKKKTADLASKVLAGKNITLADDIELSIEAIDEEIKKTKKAEKSTLQHISDSFKDSNKERASALKDFKNNIGLASKSFSGSMSSTLTGAKDGKIDVNHNIKGAEKVSVKVDNINWPQALRELVTEIIKSIVKQTRTDGLPLVLTTVPS